MRRRKPGEASEHQVQRAFFDLVHVHTARYPALALAYAIPNGGQRNTATAVRLKAEGVRPGVPDVCLPVPSADGVYRSLYIEFKRPWNDLTDRQRAFISALRRYGHRVEICQEATEAWTVVLDHLAPVQDRKPDPLVRVG